jgi:transposase-like protein|tara:strand:- start:1087 stop:1371 length:285 start_codon:yes stop_codon:yes gene_type:complete
MKRKAFTSKLKAKVAIEALKGHQTVNQIAAEFEVHPTQVNTWKKQLFEGSGDVFSKGRKQQAENAEEEKDKLYSQIGRLKVEVDWLKKKTGHLD